MGTGGCGPRRLCGVTRAFVGQSGLGEFQFHIKCSDPQAAICVPTSWDSENASSARNQPSLTESKRTIRKPTCAWIIFQMVTPPTMASQPRAVQGDPTMCNSGTDCVAFCSFSDLPLLNNMNTMIDTPGTILSKSALFSSCCHVGVQLTARRSLFFD